MTANNIRTLAEVLEAGWMSEQDRKDWVRDLRAHANDLANAVLIRTKTNEDNQENRTGQTGLHEQ